MTIKGGIPHKSLLDQVVPDRPVILDAADGHSSWANSRALEAAGIERRTSDPPRGRIDRDPETGEPTGILHESATGLVVRKAPHYTQGEFVDGLRRGLKLANRFGITSVQEAAVTEQHLKAFAELDRSGELTVRTVAAIRFDPSKDISQVPQLVEWRTTYQGKRLRTTAVKIFEDGVIETRTAALLQPYLGAGREERGWLNLEPEVLNAGRRRARPPWVSDPHSRDRRPRDPDFARCAGVRPVPATAAAIRGITLPTFNFSIRPTLPAFDCLVSWPISSPCGPGPIRTSSI